MTLLQPGQRRRNPVGRHRCVNCDAIFALDEADVATIPNGPQRDSNGDLWWYCPECAGLVKINRIGATEPPAP
jgi:hypothetical protein